jgi:hypothetical protein
MRIWECLCTYNCLIMHSVTCISDRCRTISIEWKIEWVLSVSFVLFFYPEVTSKLFLVGNIKPQTKTSIAYMESLLVSHIAIYLHMILSVSFKCIVVKLLETKIFFALLKIKIKIKIKIFFDVINELTKSSQIY